MSKIPLVVIAGRPNVGKSTLFNRIIRKRRAITDPRPGVTRDVLCETVDDNGFLFELRDTGGIRGHRDAMDEAVAKKAEASIQAADLILFVLDVMDKTPEDDEVAALLRPHAAKTVLVANKVDGEERESRMWEFARLGFSSPLALSAAHGRGLQELMELIRKRLGAPPPVVPVVHSEEQADDVIPEPQDETEPSWEPGLSPVSIAILGKPNTGKSSLLNLLAKNELSIVSNIPGTTRDVVPASIQHKGRSIRIMDTAGIRRKAKVQDNVEYYSVTRALDAISDADVVLLMIDAVEGLAEQDKKIAQQVVNNGRALIIVLNKTDLIPDRKQQDKLEDRLRYLFPVLGWAPVCRISAKTGQGVSALLTRALQLADILHTRIETGRLNQALARWVEKTPAPILSGKKFKVRYITQTRTAPLRFVAFVNRGETFPESYAQYLKNQLRAEFGFEGVPIQLDIRTRATKTPWLHSE